jgi:hypothetical protein
MDYMIRARWFILIASLSSGACDPGWGYRAPGGSPSQDQRLTYDIPGTPGLGVRVYASAFAGSLLAEVSLTNSGTTPLELASPHLVVIDARGVSLREQFPGRVSCPLQEDTDAIPPGSACTLSTSVEIQPLVRGFILMRPNPDLGTIRIRVASRGPSSAPAIEIPLVWDD